MIEKEILKEELLKGKSKKQLAADFKISVVTLRKIIKFYNFENYYCYNKSADIQIKNKSVDIDFFKCINNEAKAYTFGLILSDGYISKDRIVGITLQESDVDILFKIKDIMQSKHKIATRFKTVGNNCCRFDITSREIVKDLQDLGVTTTKSFDASIPFNKIPNELIRHVLRGIFDGDGSFSQNRPCIATSSEQLKNDIVNWSFKNFNYSPSVYTQNNNFRIYFNKEGFKIICNMYENSNIVLTRKMNSFQEYYKYRIKNQ